VPETLFTRRAFAGAVSALGCFAAGGAAASRNFELEVEARSRRGAPAVIRFHKKFEIRVGDGDRHKTGSLIGLRHVYKQFIPEGRWFKLSAAVRGSNVQVRLDGMLVVDYTDPGPLAAAPVTLRGPKDAFRGLVVKPLADDVRGPGPAPQFDAVARQIAAGVQRGIPAADLHTHLKLGLTLEQAVAKSLREGIQYGIAVNCGKGFPTENDAAALAFIESLKGQPVFVAMQAEGREWVQMFSRKVVEQFDYVFTDSMTWTDNRGKRMRTWLPNEVGTISDPQEFMDTLVDRAVGILETERVNIYANPTFLPDAIVKDYETLWTDRRRKRVIDAALKGGVAIEINNRYKLPSPSFIKMAKAAGAKFTFGTNNTGPADLGRCEYGWQMVDECKLEAKDFWLPKTPRVA
jgi:hypothetical protein